MSITGRSCASTLTTRPTDSHCPSGSREISDDTLEVILSEKSAYTKFSQR
jgi:hypothetical protein